MGVGVDVVRLRPDVESSHESSSKRGSHRKHEVERRDRVGRRRRVVCAGSVSLRGDPGRERRRRRRPRNLVVVVVAVTGRVGGGRLESALPGRGERTP